ncbi:MAG: M23 family metallopeptidase [Candidatus Babeliales bacterium]
MVRIKHIIVSTLIGGFLWASWNMYGYFFENKPPQITVETLCEKRWYKGDVACTIRGEHPYKVSAVSVYLDDQPLITNQPINKQSFAQDFTLPTATFDDGQHTLKVVVTSANKDSVESIEQIRFFVDNEPLQIGFVRSEDSFKIMPGRTFHMQIHTNKHADRVQAKLGNKVYDCFPEEEGSTLYECFIPFSCETKVGDYPFMVMVTDAVGNYVTLASSLYIIPCNFKKQKLTIEAPVFEKEKELGKSQRELEIRMKELTKKSPAKKMWHRLFEIPVELTGISTDFGTKRTSQEKGKYQHAALDLLSAPRSVVWAPNDGLIVIKDRYEQTGNTIVIDHGYGLLSLLCHLDSFADIAVGDFIRKGNPIGKLGKTGYASGYHLHWEMRLGNVLVDPAQWTQNNF